MASAVVRIKTAVDTNELVKANNQIDSLSKSLKKLATGGGVGLAIAAFTKIKNLTKQAVGEWAKAEGATSEFVKAQDKMTQSTERLKKALAGSLVAGGSGRYMTSLSNALDKVSKALEEKNRIEMIKKIAANGGDLSNYSTEELLQRRATAELNLKNAKKGDITGKSAMTMTGNVWVNLGNMIADKMSEKEKAENEAIISGIDKILKERKIAEKELEEAKKKAEEDARLQEFLDKWLPTIANVTGDAADKILEIQKKQAQEVFDKSNKTQQDIENYLMATNMEFKKLVEGRNGELAGTDLQGKAQEAINALVYAVQKGLDQGKNIEEAVNGAEEAAENGAEACWAIDEDFQTAADKIANTVLSNTGELGGIIQAGMEEGGVGVVVYILGIIMQRLSQASSIINALFNCISFMLDTLIEPLVKILEPYVLPVVGLLQVVAEALVPIFEILDYLMHPLYENIKYTAMAATLVVKLLTAIFKSIAAIFKTLKEFFTKGVNGNYNSIWNEVGNAWKEIGNTAMHYEDYLEGVAKKTKSSSAYNSATASASYTAARDIYVTINYSNSYVNGDAQEIALNLRDEIRRAEKMGY